VEAGYVELKSEEGEEEELASGQLRKHELYSCITYRKRLVVTMIM
jgi:hypothetical protein